MIQVKDYTYPKGWADPAKADESSREYCVQLEQGKILCFDSVPFDLSENRRDFLLTRRQADSRFHKNVSYRPVSDELRGFPRKPRTEFHELQSIMRDYSRAVADFISRFLSPYCGKFALDYASFRPFEEESRDLPFNKRNDLLHVDSFPTRPVQGRRILRVFTNIDRTRPRVWNTGEPFDVIAPKLARAAGLEAIASTGYRAPVARSFRRALRVLGPKQAERSAYDRFMLRFHDFLKENADFQTKCPKIHTEFAPGATWLVFTDGVPHAVMSGRFALEQTFIVPVDALVAPDTSPLRTLESLCGTSLA